MKKISLIIASLLIFSSVIFYSCTKEESKKSETKIETKIPKMASPAYAAMIKKLAGIIGDLLGITIDIKTGFFEGTYYPNGKPQHIICHNGDAICVLTISTSTGPTNPGFILGGLLGKNEKGEILCCIDESADPESYKNLINKEGFIDLTSNTVIDDESILSFFQIESPIVIEKGHIPYQRIEGITIINLGIH